MIAALTPIAILVAALALASPAYPDDGRTFEVVQTGPGAYRARGSFVVDTPLAIAWSAITDYEAIPRVAPSVKVSRILRRDGTTVVVEQEAIATVILFSKTIRLLLQIVESPQRQITFRDVGNADFKSYVGFWTIEELPHGLRVSYGLDVERGFAAPDFLARPFFRKQAESLMATMHDDIRRRAASTKH